MTVDTEYQEQGSRTVAELLAQIRELEQKVARLQRERSVYAAKARLLSQELEKYRSRELRQDNTVETLLERQREMHVMLNRSHIMLAKAQNATAMLSLEFGELARALPETVSAQAEADPEQVQTVQYEIDDRIRRINDLFRMTGELSQEIAETLQGTEKAMNGVAEPSPEPPRPSGETAASGTASSAPQASAAADPAAEERQARQAAAAREAEEQTVDAVFVEDAEPSIEEQQTEETASPVEDRQVADAVLETTAPEAEPEASVSPDAQDGSEEEPQAGSVRMAEAGETRAAVPPPRDIFVTPSPAGQRRMRGATTASPGRPMSAGRPAASPSAAPDEAAEASEAREALDRLVREQEERDARGGGIPRKRGFWSRLFGG